MTYGVVKHGLYIPESNFCDIAIKWPPFRSKKFLKLDSINFIMTQSYSQMVLKFPESVLDVKAPEKAGWDGVFGH